MGKILLSVTLFVFTFQVFFDMNAASKYVKCTPAKDHLPSVCDCTKLGVVDCMIKLNITRNPLAPDTEEDSNNVYFINNEKIGPTLIAKINTYVVVDVFNSLKNDTTSIHWHGMHQYNTAYMDGVANITQEPIRPSEALRYVFKAWPAGTHWYHSHVKNQRDKGIYGALIVLPDVQDYPDIIDEPNKNVIAIREHEFEKENSTECEPDHSKPPVLFGEITSIRINEYELGTELNSNQFAPLFYVTYKRRYRFRVIGVMFANAFRLSIDGHKLNVIAADGYSTLKKTVDYLVVHVGERYDIEVIPPEEKTIDDSTCCEVYPIRIESIGLNCETGVHHTGFAYLQYRQSEYPCREKKLIDVYGQKKRCDDISCTAINCPFKNYPSEDILCLPVTSLQLLHHTPKDEMPTKNEKLIDEYFFNFGFRDGWEKENKTIHAVVNGVRFLLPSIPFTNPDINLRPQSECKYDTIDNSSNKNKDEVCKFCAHAVYIHRSNGEQRTTRFVFSSLTPFSDESINETRTHPIHLHGHSFFVTKIGYAKYDQNGFVYKQNGDVTVQHCGPGNWTDGKRPSDLYIDQSTVRKDVITVPAGGYVVIEFLPNHPGWWLMHCHIDHHLTMGMGIAVGELPECQVPFAGPLPADESFDYELSTSVLKAYENYDKCNLQSSPCETCENDKEKDESLSFDETHSSVKKEFPRSEEGMSKSVHQQDEKHLHNLRRQMFNLMKNDRVNYGHAASHYRWLYHYYNSPQADKLKHANQKMSEPSKEWSKKH